MSAQTWQWYHSTHLTLSGKANVKPGQKNIFPLHCSESRKKHVIDKKNYEKCKSCDLKKEKNGFLSFSVQLYLRWTSVWNWWECKSPAWGGVRIRDTVWYLGGWKSHQWLKHQSEDESFHQTSCHCTIRPQSGHANPPIAVSAQHRQARHEEKPQDCFVRGDK